MIGLVLSNPAPLGWAVDALPARTTEPLPVKATLLVCPAALLPQWEQEIKTHTRSGAITFATYLGLGGNSRRRGAIVDEPEDGSVGDEVLMRRRNLFVAGDPPVAECDVVLVSFETLRDELRKCQFDNQEGGGLPLSMPLGALGFWRVVLDEAQLVSQTTSKAALMCSAILRKHAWVVTGTPVTRSPDELHGLLAFLGVAPMHEKYLTPSRNYLGFGPSFGNGPSSLRVAAAPRPRRGYVVETRSVDASQVHLRLSLPRPVQAPRGRLARPHRQSAAGPHAPPR